MFSFQAMANSDLTKEQKAMLKLFECRADMEADLKLYNSRIKYTAETILEIKNNIVIYEHKILAFDIITSTDNPKKLINAVESERSKMFLLDYLAALSTKSADELEEEYNKITNNIKVQKELLEQYQTEYDEITCVNL